VLDAASEHQQVLEVDGLHLPGRDARFGDRGRRQGHAPRYFFVRLADLGLLGLGFGCGRLAAGAGPAAARALRSNKWMMKASCLRD
jgi:hypothetical protein